MEILISVRNGHFRVRLTKNQVGHGRGMRQHAKFVELGRRSVTIRNRGALIAKASVLLGMIGLTSRSGACHAKLSPVQWEVITKPHSSAPDNQAVLDRIERLERTLLESSRYFQPSALQCRSSSQTASSASRSINVAKASTFQSNPQFFTVESVLSWPIFERQFDSSLNLRELMTNPDSGNLDHLSPQSSGKNQNLVGVELESCSNLLDKFFGRIHIKNPILDEKEIRQWAREISFNGIGWDSRSCLVVSGLSKSYSIS